MSKPTEWAKEKARRRAASAKQRVSRRRHKIKALPYDGRPTVCLDTFLGIGPEGEDEFLYEEGRLYNVPPEVLIPLRSGGEDNGEPYDAANHGPMLACSQCGALFVGQEGLDIHEVEEREPGCTAERGYWEILAEQPLLTRLKPAEPSHVATT